MHKGGGFESGSASGATVVQIPPLASPGSIPVMRKTLSERSSLATLHSNSTSDFQRRLRPRHALAPVPGERETGEDDDRELGTDAERGPERL